MRKKILLIILAVVVGTTSLTAIVNAVSLGQGVVAYEYIKWISSDQERFKHRNTLMATRIDIEKNRIYVLFDAEYLLKMDERKQFFGDRATNGVGRLVLGWADNLALMNRELPDDPVQREGRRGYFERHALFRETLYDYMGFQIPDMVEVELPARFLREQLRDNRSGVLYYYLEAFGFMTEGFIDYRSCINNFTLAGGECTLAITDDGRLDYGSRQTLNADFSMLSEPARVVDWVEPEPEPEPEPRIMLGAEPEPEPEPELEPEPEPEPEPELELAPEPEPEPEIIKVEPDPEPEPEVVDPETEVIEPNAAEPEMEPEPEPDLEPEPEPEPEIILYSEPEPEPEPEIEIEPEVVSDLEPLLIIAGPEVREVKVEESVPLTEEVAAVAVIGEINRGDGGAKSGAVIDTTISVPNTGYKNSKKEWGFLVWPLVGAAILAFWWFWPYKRLKKVKKSRKKVLTFFLSRDKMVTV